jgi:4-hydroxy-2-oxoheptanedioate aldolase
MSLREVWDRGGATVGGWCVIPSPFAAELMGRCGFDWVCLDTQHGLIGYDQMLPMLEALSATGTPSLVRVSWNHPPEIMKALDAGAEGVIVPLVNSAADARQAVGACRYPPDGYRSWGPTRASLQSGGFTPQSANRSVVCIVMIETAEAISNLDEILAVPGVDGVYVGPNDIAVTHGLEPSAEAEDPAHQELILKILAGCKLAGIIAGVHCGSVETAARWREAGFRMLNINSDGVFLRQGARQVLQRLGKKPGSVEQPKSSYA